MNKEQEAWLEALNDAYEAKDMFAYMIALAKLKQLGYEPIFIEQEEVEQ